MSRGRVRLLAAAVTLAVIGAGAAYAQSLETEFASSATIAASPRTAGVSQQGIDIERAGTIGTYGALLRSPATLRAAGSPPIEVTTFTSAASSVVLRVVARGDEDVVRPGLRRVIAAAQDRQDALGDAWQMEVLSAPTAPAATSRSPEVVRAAVIFAAVLAGLAILIVPGRFGGEGDVWALGAADLHFEPTLVRVGPLTDSTSMLRVWGLWHNVEPRRLGTPELVVRDGHREVRIPQARIPGAADPVAGPDPTEWQAAFGIPAALFGRIGPPDLVLETPEGSFPLRVEPEVWAQASPDAIDAPVASTSS